MTADERKDWIAGASFEELLRKWRFEKSGSPWFQGEVGKYYDVVMSQMRKETPEAERVAASKALGWDAEGRR